MFGADPERITEVASADEISFDEGTPTVVEHQVFIEPMDPTRWNQSKVDLSEASSNMTPLETKGVVLADGLLSGLNTSDKVDTSVKDSTPLMKQRESSTGM